MHSKVYTGSALLLGLIVAGIALAFTLSNSVQASDVAPPPEASCCPNCPLCADGACCPDDVCCDMVGCTAEMRASCCPDDACCPEGACCTATGQTTAKTPSCCPEGHGCPDGACCGGLMASVK